MMWFVVILCHFMSSIVIWIHVILCHFMSSIVIWIHVILCHFVSFCNLMSFLCHLMSYYVIWCHIMWFDMSFCVIWCLIMSFFVILMSFYVIWCHFVSFYVIISCHLKTFVTFMYVFFSVFWVVDEGYCARFLCCGKCLMLPWCFAMADFLFLFLFFVCAGRWAWVVFWHVEIVVCRCVFLCSGLISWFCAINSLFWGAGHGLCVNCFMTYLSYDTLCVCVVD